MSISDFITQKVEAGRKQLTIDESVDKSVQSLRRQRDDLQQEVDHLRERLEKLENELQRTAYGDIEEYVEEHPGASDAEIIQHIADSVPNRVVSHLDVLESESIKKTEEGYYPRDSDQEESSAETRGGKL
ncbi:hypothetical protein [Halovenus sp. HT40]|uniref:hypothetical protein n=1 Tax=Halovenus sp. HT40 TaxID=3126691 RepID=UPI00300F3170